MVKYWEEIIDFLKNSPKDFPELNNEDWYYDLCFLTDIAALQRVKFSSRENYNSIFDNSVCFEIETYAI